ncbi:glycosyltransferase [Clostridiaceae bacterium]|nr:glycosyltransferase [Clostridiaceae bacterium]RKI18016.1 glycosyltransferase [bacterium 1XD21-70]
MITVSLCMIVKNEEPVLARCLETVGRLVDEIIIVDTGSEDKTREIAGEYGAKVYEFAWKDDFAAARNEAFSKASMDYCMWLDADDVLTEENQKKLSELKGYLDKDTDVVMMKYETARDGEGNPLFSYERERLIRNGKGFRWEGRVHEAIVPSGKIVHSDIAVTHCKMGPGDGDRNLRIYERMIQEGEVLSGRSLFYYGRELLAHKRYGDAIKVFESFLGGDGWVENKIEACLNLAECFRALGQAEEAARALLGSFLYGSPRGEACFELGQHFQSHKQWRQAVFWYETALRLNPEEENGGFVRWDYYGYLPEINLCVCYDRLGDRQKAYSYHRRSKKRKPDAEAVLWNEKYFHDMGMDEPKLQMDI